MQTKYEIVKQAIHFQNPSRIALWYVNCDQTDGDVMVYHLSLNKENTDDHEWGYHMEALDDGTMGYPTKTYIPNWESFKSFTPPTVQEERRLAKLPAFLELCDDRYRLASLDLSGFTVYTLLRGFENSMVDFMAERDHFSVLMDMIVQFENDMATLVAKRGFHGIHFADDWGTQKGLMISPKLWRELFKPRYKRQFEHAHQLGLDVWFHCCGDLASIAEDFHEIGVDVLNIAQPNVVDTEWIGNRLRGKQCFLMPISYQTVSISGTVEEIYAEAKKLYGQLAAEKGGFVGYVEEYGCMGMSEENYRACSEAFRRLKVE